MPTATVLPHIRYQNVADALAWLTTALGFLEHSRYGGGDGQPDGVQMHLGGAWIMLQHARTGRTSPAQLGYGTQTLTVFVDDVDAHWQRAKAADAKIVEDLHETIYGERQCGVLDLDGHAWLFSTHARDVDPREWGATVAGG